MIFVNGLRMRGIEVNAVGGEMRPAIVCDDVKRMDVDGLRVGAVGSAQPVVKLIDTRGAFLRGCQAPAGTKVFLDVQGSKSERIFVAASDLSAAEKTFQLGEGVPPAAVVIK